ncbi:MAG: hypothetical protein M1826_007458 [Phylliscum demangeonii]|nr:MAG: hypothetical protein M1826_007458 [Phylliscum demangeonii]
MVRSKARVPSSAAPTTVLAQANGLSSKTAALRPSSLHFPLLVLSSLALSSVLYTIAARYSDGELGGVSRRLTEWWEVAGLVGWKAVELGIGWWSNYDGIDLASLTLLSHLPPLYLLTSFYQVRPITAVISLAIDILATYVPFRLLRPLLPAHKAATTRARVPNRSIITDLPVRVVTTLLAAAIYSVTVFASYRTWLPVHLVTHFDGLRDISAAHSPVLPWLFASFLPVGYAAHEFLFTPFTGSSSDPKDRVVPAFNPVTATLGETLRYNLWGYSRRSKFIITRTLTLMAVTGLHTWLHTFITLDGAESAGAVGWSSVWVLAVAVTGFAFGWVGDV